MVCRAPFLDVLSCCGQAEGGAVSENVSAVDMRAQRVSRLIGSASLSLSLSPSLSNVKYILRSLTYNLLCSKKAFILTVTYA